MRLISLRFFEHKGTPQEWGIEGLLLGPRTLIVGRNASGKSRTLNVIGALARNLAGLIPPGTGTDYECEFLNGTDRYKYELTTTMDQRVTKERLTLNGSIKLDRGNDGAGTIFAEAEGRDVRFQAPQNVLAAVARRDEIQHKFLGPLYLWASSLRHVYFGTDLGKSSYAIFMDKSSSVPDDRDPNAVVALFRQALKDFGEPFKQAVIRDLQQVDYGVNEVGVAAPVSIRVLNSPGELYGLYVKENDLPGVTDQNSMSQGMFRVLSLLIYLNYFELKRTGACILIDDIGEGLDFDRSCRLVDLVRNRASTSDVQVVLATNDRFVMNRVPLEEWSVLQRTRNHVRVRNYTNSKSVFEEFKFTGLSNFSLLQMDIMGESDEAGTNPRA